MSATDELRALLDAAGVEWYQGSQAGWYETEWVNAYGTHSSSMEWNPTLTVILSGLTPAQAIDATLGRGECHNTSNVTDEHGQARFVCSECGAWLDSRLLWNPEYPNGESPWVKECKLNYCPNCGARIVEVDE